MTGSMDFGLWLASLVLGQALLVTPFGELL